MIEKFLSLIKKKDRNDWQKVKYPNSLPVKMFGFVPIRIILLITLIFLEFIITMNIADKIHSNIGQILITIIFFYLIYKTIIHYRRFQKMKQEGKNNSLCQVLVGNFIF